MIQSQGRLQPCRPESAGELPITCVTRGVTLLTLHVVGSNNNRGRTFEGDREYRERTAANLAWQREGFGQARANRSRAIMIIWQANPGFELPPNRRTGFNETLAALEEETVAFDGPVVLVLGDSHYFRIDKPMTLTLPTPGVAARSRVEHFTRVETFGRPSHHWLQVAVDYTDPSVFVFRPRIIEENLAGR